MLTSPLVLRLLACASLASAASSSSTTAKTTPQRITYTSLSSAADSSDDLLLDALTKDGFVSITDIRSQHGLHFREMKHNLMSNLHACMVDIGEDVPMQHLDDGTVRKSFATATLPPADEEATSSQQQPIHLLDEYLARNPHKSAACHAFQEHLSDFRSTVGDATRLFAARLSVELGVALPSPLLLSSNDNMGNNNYDDVESVVMGGEHLEHFHSYQKGDDEKEGDDSTATIELHTDQGLFIAFTPGMLVDHSTDQSLELSDGFYVQDSTTGENVLLEFTKDDDLVFMLGDGVNQIINNQLGDEDGKKVLRATPHALSLSNEQPRVWYGRMVLPANDAYLPEAASTTFGQLRQAFVKSSSKGQSIPMGIGCSSNSKMVINTSRFLADEGHDEDEGGHGVSENQCADDSMFCWYRCMALTEETATCAEHRLGLQCVDPRGLVVEGGAGHGDFFPGKESFQTISSHSVDLPQTQLLSLISFVIIHSMHQ